MAQTPNLSLRISVDGASAKTGIAEVTQGFSGLKGQIDNIERSSAALTNSISRMGHAAAGLFAGQNIAQAADAWANLSSRIKLSTGSLQESAQALGAVFNIAQKTGQDLASIGDIYQKISRNARQYGLDQQAVVGVTQDIANAMKLSGSSAASASAALLQFGQSLAAGQLRGEELNSVLEQAPALAEAIARGMGKTTGELKKMGEDGLLPVKDVLAAIRAESARLEDESGQMAVTISSAIQRLKNAFDKFVGTEAGGAAGMVAQGIGVLADNLDNAARAAVLAGGAMAAMKLADYAKAVQAAVVAKEALIAAELASASAAAGAARAQVAKETALIASRVAVDALAAAEARLAAAQSAAAAGPVLASLLRFGPIVAGVTALVGAGIIVWKDWKDMADLAAVATDNAAASARKLTHDLGKAVTEVGTMTRAAYSQQMTQALLERERVAKAAAAAQERLANFSGNRVSDEFVDISTSAARARTELRQVDESLAQFIAAGSRLGQTHLDRYYEKFGSSAQKAKSEVDGLNKAHAEQIQRMREDGATVQEIAAVELDYRQKLAELRKKSTGADAGKNDLAQAFAADIKLAQDYSKTAVEVIQEKVRQQVLTEREGIDQTLAALNEGYARQAKLLKDRLAGTQDGGERKQIMAQIVALGNDAAVAAEKAASGIAKLGMESEKAHEKVLKTLQDEASALVAKADAAEQENARIGLTADALGLLTARRYDERIELLQDKAAAMEALSGRTAEVEAIEAQIAALYRLKAAEVTRPKLQEQAREWEKFTDEINRSLTDALFRAFESGSGFGKSFAETLGNTLKAAVAKALINVAITTGSNALNTGINALLGTSGANNGAGTNYLGLASNASSIYNLANGTYATAGLAAYSQYQAGIPIAQWSLTNAAPVTTAVNTSGVAANGMAPSSGAGAASTVAWVAAIVAGMWMSSQAWKQGIKWDNYAKQPGVQYWDAEVGMRAMHDKPAELLFGKDFVNSEFYAVMGGGSLSAQIHYGIQSALFGRTRVTGSQLSGTFSEAEQGFTGRSGVNMKKSGGLFSRSREWTEWSDLPTEVDGIFDALYRGVRNSFVMLGDVFGDSGLAGKIDGFVYKYTDDGFETIEEQISKMADQLTAAIGKTLLPSIEGLAVTTEQNGEKITETWNQTFQRVVVEAYAVNAAFDLLGNSLATIYGNNTDKILAASDAFIKLFGSIDAMSASINAYYDNFYTAAEKQDRAWQQIESAMAAIGVTAVPKTREAFREMADSYLKAGDSGAATFKSLMDIQGAFAALVPATTDAAAALNGSADAARRWAEDVAAALLDGFDSARGNLRNTADRNLAALRDAAQLERDRITAARQAASEQLTGLRSMIDLLQNNSSTLRGDTAAAGPLGDAAAAWLRQAANTATASGYLPDSAALADAIGAARSGLNGPYASTFDRDFAKLTLAGDLDRLQAVAGKQLPVAERALAVADDQLKALDDSLRLAEQQVDALFNIDDGIADLHGSIADMSAAIVKALQDNIGGLNAGLLAAVQAGTIGSADAASRLPGVATDQITTVGGRKYFVSSQGAIASDDGKITANTGWQGSIDDAKRIVAEAFSAMAPPDFYAAAKKVGLSSSMIDAMYGFESGTALAWAKANNLPAFDQGANRIPQDMLAIVHKDEAIIPAAYNPALGNGGNDRLERLVEAMTTEIQRLNADIAEMRRDTRRTANAVNGNAEQPMLVETVA